MMRSRGSSRRVKQMNESTNTEHHSYLTRSQEARVLRVTGREKWTGLLWAGVILAGVSAAIMLVIFIGLYGQGPTFRVTPMSVRGLDERTEVVWWAAEEVEEPEHEEWLTGSADLDSAVKELDMGRVLADLDRIRGDSGVSEGRRRKLGVPEPEILLDEDRVARWRIDYAVSQPQQYLQQLDDFGIELAAVSAVGDEVLYAVEASGAVQLRRGLKSAEKRVYFVHGNPKLRHLDRQLLQGWAAQWDSGEYEVSQQDVAVQFFPPQLIERMAALEDQQVQRDGRRLAEVLRSEFRLGEGGEADRLSLQRVVYRSERDADGEPGGGRDGE